MQTGRCAKVATLGGLAVLIAAPMAWSQINRGAIRGTVTDPQGAVVPAGAIAIRNTETGVEQRTVDNSAGFYLVPNLLPGTYTVHLASPGFKAVDIANVVVNANDVTTVDISLEVGPTTQHIEVKATAPLLETTASNFSTPIVQQYIDNLPILGRDIQSLAQLIPGVTQSNGPPGTLVGFQGQFGGFPDATHIVGSEVAVNGSQAGANIWYLDGSLNAAEGVDNVVINPPPDAVAEFQAVNNGFAAEYGLAAGAIFNVVLKSGTNHVHGDLYEYNRNSHFSARSPFGQTSPSGGALPPNFVNWNQFGGTIGGPVAIPHFYSGKDRTFFFAAWDVSLLHEASNGTLLTVPTLRMRQGDFSEFPSVAQFGLYDPLSTRYNSSLGHFTRQPFVNANGGLAASLPSNRIDPFSQWLINQFPAPNFLDPRQQNAEGCLNTCNNYLGTYRSGQTTHSVVLKVDHEISEKDKLFVEWLFNPTYYRLLTLPWQGPTAPEIGFNGSYPWNVTNQIAALGYTHTFGPSFLNEFRFMFSRQNNVPLPIPNSLGDSAAVLQHLQGLNVPSYPGVEPAPTIQVNGPTISGGYINGRQATSAATVTDTITKVFSKHTLKAGFMFRDDLTGTDWPTAVGLSFGSTGLTSNPATSNGGNPWAEFLLGAVDQGSFVGITPAVFGSAHTWSFYLQDDYRVTRSLTINFGLRYDIYGWYDERHNHGSVFDFNHPNPDIPTRMGREVYLGTPQHPSGRVFPANLGDFGPRFNFAYSPFTNGKTVIRGGIDLIYTNGLTQRNGQGGGAFQSYGCNTSQTWESDATGQGLVGTNVVPAFILSQGATSLPPCGDPRADNAQLLGPTGAGVLTDVNNHRDPNVTVWNFQVQRELPGQILISVGYVGSKGTELIGQNNQSYDYVPTKARMQYRSKLNELVPMPADLAPLFGRQYFRSQLFFPYPQYSSVYNQLGVDNSSSYNGLQAKLEKRLSYGLNFFAAYAFQKTIASPGLGGFLSNTWTGGPSFGSRRGRIGQLPGLGGFGGYTAYQDPDNKNGDRGLAPDDIPQVFNFAWTYELPFGPGKPIGGSATGVARALIQGWTISNNFNAQGGVPLEIRGPCNDLTCRVNLIGDPNSGRGSKTRYQQEQQWFNPSAFQAVFGSDPQIINLATNGTPAQKDQYNEFWRFGTLTRRPGNVRSPGFWNADLSLAKHFKISESTDLEFRADSYNVFNHQNLGLPNTHWCLPPNPDGTVDAVHQFGCQFGQIYNIQTDPRAFEFALKFKF